MALITGTHLGPYEILSAVGAGGMGRFIRARDTQLNRHFPIDIFLLEMRRRRWAASTWVASSLAGCSLV